MPVFDGCTFNFVGLIMHMLIYLSDVSFFLKTDCMLIKAKNLE